MRFLIVLSAVFLAQPAAFGQCVNGQCPLQQPAARYAYPQQQNGVRAAALPAGCPCGASCPCAPQQCASGQCRAPAARPGLPAGAAFHAVSNEGNALYRAPDGSYWMAAGR